MPPKPTRPRTCPTRGGTDAAEADQPEQGNPDVDVAKIRPQQSRHQNRDVDQQPTHRRSASFVQMRFGSVLANRLADLELPQPPDQPGPQDQAQPQRHQAGGGRTERDVAEDAERSEIRKKLLEEKVKKHDA